MTEAPMLPDAHCFDHEAMNTVFGVRILGGDAQAAGGMARECFDLLDSLEDRLSRYVEGSDVSLINRMEAGETFYPSESCYECLRLAIDAHVRTGGLFDITLGARIEHRKSKQDGPMPAIAGQLTLHPDAPAISCAEAGREIDLGGIGKGFALDRMRDLLVEWGAEGGLVAAGASTLLAFGEEAWPVELAGDGGGIRLALKNRALSASGTGIQGSHIIDPRAEEGEPAGAPVRLWAVSGSAAMADALSTALMLMSRSEMDEFLQVEELVEQVYLESDGRVVECGGRAS